MKIALASDHGGYALKETVKKYLTERNIEVLDLGTDSEESVDYPVFGKAAAEAVADGRADRGIVCCGTGIGISIAANKVKGIRCALCTDVHMADTTMQICLQWEAGQLMKRQLLKSQRHGLIQSLRAADIREELICLIICS